MVMVLVLGAYLIHSNINVGSYNANKDNRSTANYLLIAEEEPVEEEKEEVEEIEEVKEEVKEEILYDGKTIDEIANILNKSLNSTMSGKGYLIASHSIELGVDPYMATAIILQETGCKWECSYLVKTCNNVGGQKGSGCGSYQYYDNLDDGIIWFIDNLYNRYVKEGLTTPELINPKYAEDTNWSVKVNNYIDSIKAQ